MHCIAVDDDKNILSSRELVVFQKMVGMGTVRPINLELYDDHPTALRTNHIISNNSPRRMLLSRRSFHFINLVIIHFLLFVLHLINFAAAAAASSLPVGTLVHFHIVKES